MDIESSKLYVLPKQDIFYSKLFFNLKKNLNINDNIILRIKEMDLFVILAI